MTQPAANQLFSHPETHHPHTKPSSPDATGEQSWTNLFQEPVPAQRPSSEG